jgi:Holliday junction resolvase RusA-like endonuclease
MDPVVIHVPGPPVAKGRPRFFGGGRFPRAYTPKETEAYETTVRWYAAREMAKRGLQPLDGALSVTIEFTLPIPPSWSQRKKDHAVLGSIMPIGRPDSDNLAKAITDAANGHIWRDDSQIVELIVRKRYGEPGATMTVTLAGQSIEQRSAA